MADPVRDDPLERLRERIRATQEAAERLAAEAAARSGPADAPPPHGDPLDFDEPPPHGGDPFDHRPEDETLHLPPAALALVEALRGLVPRELQHQLTELVRELLLAVRALIEWCLDHLEARRARAVEVEDIPID